MINPALMSANGTNTHVSSVSTSSDFLNVNRCDLLICFNLEGSTDTIIEVCITNV